VTDATLNVTTVTGAAWNVPEKPNPETVTASLFVRGIDPEEARSEPFRLELEFLDGVFWAGGSPVVPRPRPLDRVTRHWSGAELEFEIDVDDARETRYVRLYIDGSWRFGVPISRRALRQDLNFVAHNDATD